MEARPSEDIEKWQAGHPWIHGWPGSTVGPEQILTSGESLQPESSFILAQLLLSLKALRKIYSIKSILTAT